MNQLLSVSLLTACALLVLPHAMTAGCAQGETTSDDDGAGGASAGSTGSVGGAGAGPTQGLCLDACPKTCETDNGCDLSSGELCCDYGPYGAACTKATNCPRFCEDDNQCDIAGGEACLRVSLADKRRVCTQPQAALRLCDNHESCAATGELCCGIYSEALCLPSHLCPAHCESSDQCNGSAGEICCPTLKLLDPRLSASGLCINPQQTACPTGCSQSSECDTTAGEVCCEGVCSMSCARRCDQSSDCIGQVCCKSALVTSPWLAGVPAIGIAGNLGTGQALCDQASAHVYDCTGENFGLTCSVPGQACAAQCMLASSCGELQEWVFGGFSPGLDACLQSC